MLSRVFNGNLKTNALIFDGFGELSEKLRLSQTPILHSPNVKPENAIYVEMLHCPVNPSDVNQVQGVYGIKPKKFPAVGGNEGVGIVREVGPKVTLVEPNDLVLPFTSLFGTWRKATVCNEDQVFRINENLDPVAAATIKINPCSAYRMLQDFVSLKPNDFIIQNAANSSLGRTVIQLAKNMGVRSINVIRQRENEEELKKELSNLGATIVLNDKEIKKWTENIDLPVLALNAVGGESSANIFRLLRENGTMVTYGGMSQRPVVCSTGSLIFQNKKSVGFWMTNWYNNASREEISSMLEKLSNMFISNTLLTPPHKYIDPEKELQFGLQLVGHEKVIFSWKH